VIIPQVLLGAGKHIQYIPPQNLGEALRLNFISQPIFLWAITFVKLSVGFFLLRIAAQTVWRRIIQGIMIFMGKRNVTRRTGE
jgi:hypothetical protein